MEHLQIVGICVFGGFPWSNFVYLILFLLEVWMRRTQKLYMPPYAFVHIHVRTDPILQKKGLSLYC
jgi:hypothetical protein